MQPSSDLSDVMTETAHTRAEHKPRPLIDLAVSILIPADPDETQRRRPPRRRRCPAARPGLPAGLGLWELARYRKFNWIALLGLISVLLTGGIGLLQLDTQWLAIKEAAVPGIIGIAVLASTRTRYPLIRTLLYNPGI